MPHHDHHHHHGHHHGPRAHHHGSHRNGRGGPPDRLIETLRVLHDAGRFDAIDDLATIAATFGFDGQAAAEYLRTNCARLPIRLAIDKLDIHRREEAHLRQEGLLEIANNGRVALIVPLPPHIFGAFARLDGAVVICSDGHELPPHLQTAPAAKLQTNIYASRPLVRQADLVVFDAFVDGGGIWIRPSVFDLLDPLNPQAQLATHFRPHKFPEDMLASDEVQRRIVPI